MSSGAHFGEELTDFGHAVLKEGGLRTALLRRLYGLRREIAQSVLSGDFSVVAGGVSVEGIRGSMTFVTMLGWSGL